MEGGLLIFEIENLTKTAEWYNDIQVIMLDINVSGGRVYWDIMAWYQGKRKGLLRYHGLVSGGKGNL